MKAKPKLQWRPQNFGHVRTIRFTRKAVGTVWSWLKGAEQEVRRVTEGCWNTKTIRSSRCWTWNERMWYLPCSFSVLLGLIIPHYAPSHHWE